MKEKNSFKCSEERLQRFSDMWCAARDTASYEQKDAVGLAFVAEVLGVGWDVARKFVAGDREAWHTVGMVQSGVPVGQVKVDKFWARVREVFPGVYSDDDLVYLKEFGYSAVDHFLWQLGEGYGESPVFKKLADNAHAYK